MQDTQQDRELESDVPRPGVAGVIVDIRAEIAACRLCPGMKPWNKRPPESFGTATTGYMLVGEAPGHGTRPFEDRKGALLREALAAVGDPRFTDLEDLFFLADAVRCLPRSPKDRKRLRAPSVAECRTCHPYLAFEIRALHPRLIVAIGARAAEAVLSRPIKVSRDHGHRHRLGDTEVMTLAMPSPQNRATLKRLNLTLEGYRRWLSGFFGSLIDGLR